MIQLDFDQFYIFQGVKPQKVEIEVQTDEKQVKNSES